MGSDDKTRVDVTVRVAKDFGAQIDEVVRALEAAGLASVQRHDRFLVVNGTIALDGLDALRSVGGVASVRQDRVYKAQ
jgi:hypothetical protein